MTTGDVALLMKNLKGCYTTLNVKDIYVKMVCKAIPENPTPKEMYKFINTICLNCKYAPSVAEIKEIWDDIHKEQQHLREADNYRKRQKWMLHKSCNTHFGIYEIDLLTIKNDTLRTNYRRYLCAGRRKL